MSRRSNHRPCRSTPRSRRTANLLCCSTSRVSPLPTPCRSRTASPTEMAQLQSKLPAGVHLEPFYDQSELVRESIPSVRDAILIGLSAGLHHPVPLSARLDLFARRRPRYPGHRRGDHPLPLDHRPELQPDDPRRPGRGHRSGYRRRHRGGREHCRPPRSRRVTYRLSPQSPARDHRPLSSPRLPRSSCFFR